MGGNMNKINLKVNGMVCNGCENRVKNALMNIEGVSKVKASYKKSLVTISAKEDVDVKDIENVIKNLGYEIVKED